VTIEHIPLELCHFQYRIKRIHTENIHSDINGVDSVHQEEEEIEQEETMCKV
jgi:hypothetical protein